ncbi:MAG: DUF2974 domain-containing protein [Oscillospiraceae bacterium]|nr:DUF2974 domain-containing protein [Oscillospiraceae bacterium]
MKKLFLFTLCFSVLLQFVLAVPAAAQTINGIDEIIAFSDADLQNVIATVGGTAMGVDSNNGNFNGVNPGCGFAVVSTEGDLYMWGDGSKSLFGDGYTGMNVRPVEIPTPTGLTGVKAIIPGGLGFAFALGIDGTLWGWGQIHTGNSYNLFGEGYLGNYSYQDETVIFDGVDYHYGTTYYYQSTPHVIDKDVKSFSVGGQYTANYILVLHNDGHVSSRGYNYYGQLGDGTIKNSSYGTTVLNLDRCVSVSAGLGHALALKEDGTVWSWGLNYYGQAGKGYISDFDDPDCAIPSQVPGISDVVYIKALRNMSFAITADGALWGWGERLDGVYDPDVDPYDRTNATVPIKLMTDVKAITCNDVGFREESSCIYIIKTDGSLYRWDVDEEALSSAEKIMDRIAAVAADTMNTLVLTEDGQLFSWSGRNYQDAVRVPVDVELPCAEKENVSSNTLTSLDYMAMSQLAYQNWDYINIDIFKNDTIADAITPGEKVGDSNIPYQTLCRNILEWKPIVTSADMAEDTNRTLSEGFYAVTFCNEKTKQAVIAFRGSEELTQLLFTWSGDSVSDWLFNDLPFQVFHTFSAQLREAMDYYKYCCSLSELSDYDISVTGHSLGGALAETVIMRYGVYGEVFNAASVYEALYLNIPEEMSRNFLGVDKWGFIAHINENDTSVGLWENEYQNIPHKIYKDTNSASAHSLVSMLEYDTSSDSLSLSSSSEISCVGSFSIYAWDSAWAVPLDALPESMLYLGSSGDEYLKHWGFVRGYLYGGDGDDILVSNTRMGNCYVGGKATTRDIVYSGWGDDTYLFHKGDGPLWIQDSGGRDTLKLLSFTSQDVLRCEKQVIDGVSYSVILLTDSVVTDQPIIYICLNRPGDNEKNAFLVVRDENSLFNISGLWKNSYGGGSRCPVDVDIVNSRGEVILTLEDGQEMFAQTEFGNFCVYTDDSGESCKFFDLVDGYTASIRGVGEGKMDVEIFYDSRNPQQASCGVTDIPVTEKTVAAVEFRDGVFPAVQVQDGISATEYQMQIRKAITLDYGDENGRTKTIFTDYDGTVENLPELTREGYTFCGWKMKNGVVVANGDRVDGDTVLTASWAKEYSDKDVLHPSPNFTKDDPDRNIVYAIIGVIGIGLLFVACIDVVILVILINKWIVKDE